MRSVAESAKTRPGHRRGYAQSDQPHDKYVEAIKEFAHDYQMDWLRDNSRARIVNKSRKIGWTWLMAYEAVLKALYLGQDQLLVSSAEKTGQKFLQFCYDWIAVARKAGTHFKYRSHTKGEIAFEGAGSILSIAQNPSTARGWAADVYFDEFAHHAEDEAMYEAVFPTIALGGTVSIASTPLGESGLFWEIFTNPGKYPDFSRHEVTVEQAVRSGMGIDIDFLKRNMDEEAFRQEFMCQFIDDSTSFFPFQVIRQCIGDAPGTGTGYLGVDLGRRHDHTVILILRKLGDRFVISSLEVLKGKSYEYQEDYLRSTIASNDIVAGKIDSTGMGNQFAERLCREFRQLRPIPFSNQSKERMVTQLKRLMESKKVVIPDDTELISSIHSIKKTVTPSRNVIFDAARTSKGHADRFWALAMAVDAAIARTPTVEIH